MIQHAHTQTTHTQTYRDTYVTVVVEMVQHAHTQTTHTQTYRDTYVTVVVEMIQHAHTQTTHTHKHTYTRIMTAEVSKVNVDLYSASSCWTSKALRYGPCVTRGSHSFTCHPHTNHICLYSPAARHHRPLAGTNLYCLVNRGTQVWETCPGFLRHVPGRDSNPRPLDRKSDTLPSIIYSWLILSILGYGGVFVLMVVIWVVFIALRRQH